MLRRTRQVVDVDAESGSMEKVTAAMVSSLMPSVPMSTVEVTKGTGKVFKPEDDSMIQCICCDVSMELMWK